MLEAPPETDSDGETPVIGLAGSRPLHYECTRAPIMSWALLFF